MTGVWGGFAVQWRDLEGDFVLVTVIPGVVLDGEFRPHLSRSQAIEERGLCPESYRSTLDIDRQNL